MGDDRAPVYEEDGVWIIRASAAGFCMKALAAHGQGLTPADHPDFLLEKFDQGIAAEPTIQLMLEAKGVEVSREQEMVELAVGTKCKFRGHIDGVGKDAGPEDFVVEYKALGKSMADKLEKHGINSIYYYAVQLSIYMAALKKKGMLVVGLKDEDGIVVSIETYMFDEPPIPIGKIKARALKILKHIENQEMPACDYAQFPCQFHFLHDDEEVWKGRDGIEIQDDELDDLLSELFAARNAKKQLEGREKRASDGIKKIVDREGGKGQRVETEEFVFNDVVQQVKGNVDWKAAEADGVDVDKYRKEGYEKRFITIQHTKTRPLEDEDEKGEDSGEGTDGSS